MQRDNTLCLYVNESAFLIANHRDERQLNPIAFVNERGQIMFDVNIDVFANAIQEFQNYIQYYQNKHPDYPNIHAIQLATNDYVNDVLDFYANSNIVRESIIQQATDLYE